MAHVEGEIEINRPIEDVFDFVADERNEPRYNSRMRKAEKTTDGPIGVGTRFRAEIMSWGNPTEIITEFTGYERPLRLESTSRVSFMDVRGAVTFEATPAGTRMRWSWDIQAQGCLKYMGPLVSFLGRRQEMSIWSAMKRLLEEGAMSTASTNAKEAS